MKAIHNNEVENKKIRFKVNMNELHTAPMKNVGSEVNNIHLREELLYGNPSAYIVSGYRGAGKSSYINYLEDVIETNNHQNQNKLLFIKCNVSKDEVKSNILRKLIRSLWVKTQEHQTVRDELNKMKNRKLKLELDLLYKRTFYDVYDINKTSKETTKGREYNLNFVLILSLIVVPLLSLYFANIDSFIENLERFFSHTGIVVGTGLLSILSVASYIFIRKRNTTNLNEVEYKSLYDDEIAELKLLECIKLLKKLEVNTVFVIDELDKIENDQDMENLISELKPLILSGEAKFILVTGQNLYYKLEKSRYLDDAILPNLFIEPFHIPLLDNDSFKQLFQKIVINPSNENAMVYEDYFAFIFLKSNRTPRKFLNSIRNDLVWINEEPYIERNPTQNQLFSKILKSLNTLIEKENLIQYPKAQQDFLITQLHICVNKMVEVGFGYFDKNDIFDNNDEKNQRYPDGYWERAEKLIELLIQQLEADKVIELNKDTQKYTLTNSDQIDRVNKELLASQFLKDFHQLDQFLDGIYYEIVKGNTKKRTPFHEKIQVLSSKKIIKSVDSLRKIASIRNIISHSSLDVKEQANEIREAQNQISLLKLEILEQFSITTVTQFMQSKGYEVEIAKKEQGLQFDLITKHEDTEKINYVFEFNIIHALPTSFDVKISNFVGKLNQLKKQGKYVGVYIIFCLDRQIQFHIDNSLQDRNINIDPNDMFILYPLINRGEDQPFVVYLENVIAS